MKRWISGDFHPFYLLLKHLHPNASELHYPTRSQYKQIGNKSHTIIKKPNRLIKRS